MFSKILRFSSYFSQNLLRLATIPKVNARTFLSASYSQDTKWNSRLDHQIFKVESASQLGTMIFSNLDANKDVLISDYDVYLNKIGELAATDLDFVELVLKKYNTTQGILQRFDAISHAVIRSYIDFHEEHRLLNILKNKRQYGIFLDEISVNLLMNKFIQQNNWSNAISVIYDRMLQEEIERPLTILMMMETCRNYWSLKRSSGFEDVVEDKPDDDEVEYVRVKYVRNPNYDDHFDVTKDKLLLGKSFLHLARSLEESRSLIDGSKSYLIINYNLLGLALFEKYEKMVNYLHGVLDSSQSPVLCSDVLNDISTLFDWSEVLPEGEQVKRGEMHRYSSQELQRLKGASQALLDKFKSNNLVLENSLDSLAESFVNTHKERALHEEEDYVAQVYDLWIKERSERIHAENEKVKKEDTLKLVKSKLRELLEREELAHYMDNDKEILYSAWLAPRTWKEKRISRKMDWEKNVGNIDSQQKPRGIIFETPDEN